jgi:nucleoid-associated protein EbfC
MGSGFSKMKKQAKQFQQQMGKMQDDLKTMEATGVSGNGLVTLVLNGERELKSLQIKPECVDPNDVEGLQDLILAAYADASSKLSSNTQSFPGMPAGFSLPF